jgi:hypothetical protein
MTSRQVVTGRLPPSLSPRYIARQGVTSGKQKGTACILARANISRLTSITYPNGFTLRYFDLDTLTAPGLGKGAAHV